MTGALTRRGDSLPEGGDNNPHLMINGVGALSPRRVNAPGGLRVYEPCVICGASVRTTDGMWWNPNGGLHNFGCPGYGGAAASRDRTGLTVTTAPEEGA